MLEDGAGRAEIASTQLCVMRSSAFLAYRCRKSIASWWERIGKLPNLGHRWNREQERSAVTSGAAHPNVAAVSLDNTLDDGKTEPGASMCAVR